MKAVCIDFAFVSGPELLAHIFTLLKNNRLFREIFLPGELVFFSRNGINLSKIIKTGEVKKVI